MLGISRLLVIVLLKKKPEKSNTFPILQIKKLSQGNYGTLRQMYSLSGARLDLKP